MSEAGKNGSGESKSISTTARSLPLAQRGVVTARDFANLMSALMSDILEGKVPPDMANAVTNAGGKMLKVVEMQHRWGKRGAENAESLPLADTMDKPMAEAK